MFMSKEKLDCLISEIDSCLNYDELHERLRETINVAWNDEITLSSVDKWLDNFSGDFLKNDKLEKKLAMYVLLNYTYYNEKEVKYFCKVIYEKYIHNKLVEYRRNKKFSSLSDSEKEEHILKNTVFVSLGTPSESGSLILYWFREVNNLPKKVFEFNNKSKYENVVFVDDVTLSGSQATRYFKENEYYADCQYFLCFLCTDQAEKKIKNCYPDINLIYASVLDNSNKAFSDNSIVFTGKYEMFKKITKELFEYYGKKCVKEYPTVEDPYMEKYPLGFKDSQQLFGFKYNTPNNTLPLIWIDNNQWKPIFKREEKNYSDIGVVTDEKFL